MAALGGTGRPWPFVAATGGFLYHPRVTVFPTKKAMIEAFVRPSDEVLDVGFWGQSVRPDSPHWPHRILLEHCAHVHGLDLEFDAGQLAHPENYTKASAETFSLDRQFDVVFAGDLIEHLSNPGLFLDASRKHLKPGGRLVLSTPSAFNLFNLVEKLAKDEPSVNSDHTCYFNPKTIRQLFAKNGWKVEEISYIYSLGANHRESLKKKIQNALYWFASLFTTKYLETMAIVAVPA